MQQGISFQLTTGGRISLLDLEKEERPCHFDGRQVEAAISEYVGERLSAKTARLQKTYTLAELKARLVRIAFQVTATDLQEAFQLLKAGQTPAILSQLTEEERRSLIAAPFFDALTDDQLNLLMQPYRHLCKEKSVASHLFTHGLVAGSDSNSLYGQLELLKSFDKALNNETAGKIASMEYLARLLPAHFPTSENLSRQRLKGTLFPILNESGNIQLFQLQESCREGTLAIDILVPLTPAQWSQGHYPVIVLCRDTDPQKTPATLPEWQKRIQLYEQAKGKISGMLEGVIQGKNSAVTIAGNHLGAVYAQSLLGSLAAAQNEGWVLLNQDEMDFQSPLKAVRSVKLLTWDPEPVSEDCQATYKMNCHNASFNVTHDHVFFSKPLRGSSKGYLLGNPESNAKVYHLELQNRDIGWANEKGIEDKTPLAGERARLAVRTLDLAEIQTLFTQRFGTFGTAWASSTSILRNLWPLKP